MFAGSKVFLLEIVAPPLGQFITVETVREIIESTAKLFHGHVRRLKINIKQGTAILVTRVEQSIFLQQPIVKWCAGKRSLVGDLNII